MHGFPLIMTLRSTALSDIGRVRRQNEDRFLCDDTLLSYGVADGIGGLPGGAEAAQLSLEILRDSLVDANIQQADDLIPLVHTANERVLDLGREISPNVGIGTTLTFGVFRTNRLLLANVGDSRCYRIREGRMNLLTEDHSVENEARMRRARGEQVFVHEHYRNALTRCIGQPTQPDVDVSTVPIAVGDMFLFATDGVTRMLSEIDMTRVLARALDHHERLIELIRWANARGGADNATAVLVTVDALT